MTEVKIVSWNINGLRGIVKKKVPGTETHLLDHLVTLTNPDIVCLQETKCPVSEIPWTPFPYTYAAASDDKKGYSGVLVSSKIAPLSGAMGIAGITEKEGRVITLVFDKFILVNAYVPNSGTNRLGYRVNQWELAFRQHILTLNQFGKPVIVIGDLNCIPGELDFGMKKICPGATPEEKACFNILLRECDLIDTFRTVSPHVRKYSWYNPRAKTKTSGCRLDFALLSAKHRDKLISSDILDYAGSDHVPIVVMVRL